MSRAWAVAAVVVAGSPALAQDPASPLPPPAPGGPARERSALLSAVESAVGAEVHGRASLEWRSRFLRGDEHESDHDLYGRLDLRIADEARDAFSAGAMLRTAWDPTPTERLDDGRVFASLADTYDHELNALLYTAWGQWRLAEGPLDTVRVGRQFFDGAETFHFDGVVAATRPLRGTPNLRFTAYGGVPVHFYEGSSDGDGIAGFQASATPWEGGGATFDYAHVEDELSGFDDGDDDSEERDDIAALSLRHRIGATRLSGRFTYLEGASDVRLRSSTWLEEQDLFLSVGYLRLLDDREQLTTQLDPFFRVLQTLHEYHLADVRAVKGFGDVHVEAGAWIREVASDDDEGPFNRDTRRVWIAPSIDDFPWEGTQLGVSLEAWSGDGQRIKTWTADVSHRFSRDLRAELGTDYALYDYGDLQRGERTHVRSVFTKVRARLTETLSLQARYSWEKDEENTWHVLSLALSVDF